MTDWNAVYADTRDQQRALNKAAGETTKAFAGLSGAVKSNGPLDLKTKEFVAIGIAVSERCEACIAYHIKALHKAGGTREELADVLSMVIQMGGGPGIMYAGKALECWDQLIGTDAA